MGRHSNQIMLQHDFLIWNEQLAESYPHIYKILCLNCLGQFITGPHSEPKKYRAHIPKLLLQNTFQYDPSINDYDFQKVSSLQDGNPNF